MEIKKIMKQVFEIMDESPTTCGILSGYDKLDAMLNGFHKGDLVVVTGEQQLCRFFVQNIIVNQIKDDLNVPMLIISPCIPSVHYAMQLLSIKSRVPLRNIYRANSTLRQSDWDAITMAFEPIANSPFYIVDQENYTVAQLKLDAERMAGESGLDMIIIDFVQHITIDDFKLSGIKKLDSISHRLKIQAEMLDVPIITVVSSDVVLDKMRDNALNRHQLSEQLIESADIVLALNKKSNTQQGGVVAVNVQKRDRSPMGDFKLLYSEDSFRFDDLSEDLKSFECYIYP